MKYRDVQIWFLLLSLAVVSFASPFLLLEIVAVVGLLAETWVLVRRGELQSLGLRKVPVSYILGAFLAGLAVCGTSLWIVHRYRIPAKGVEPMWAVLYAIALSPLMEEVFFRQVLFGWLWRKTKQIGMWKIAGNVLAISVSSMAFGFAHSGRSGLLLGMTIANGVFYSLWRMKTSSVVPGFIMHLTFNAASLAALQP